MNTPPRPQRVMDWKRRRSWQQFVHLGLVRLVGTDYPALLREAVVPIEAPDDSGAVFAALAARASREDLVREAERRWGQFFTHVMAYHACRTVDVSKYYRRGIRPLDVAMARQAFRDRFSAPPHSVPPAQLDVAIASVPMETIERRVHLGLDDRDLADDCGHYLVYGGEYFHALVVGIPGRGEEFRAELRKSGRATVLQCCLPARWIRHRRQLVSSMIADHAYAVVHGHRSPHWLDHTVTLKHGVRPRWIVSHRHPRRIRDPFNWRIWDDRLRRHEG